MTLDGRIAVVTGGTRGVGRGVALALAQAGARVFVTGRTADEALAGARAHYRASQLSAPSMIAGRRGLIVNISHWAAQKHIGNVAYGVSKAATDKLTWDMAFELKPHGVAVVSLYPGMVRTEKVMEAAQWLDLSNSESPEFVGRAIAALASDSHVMRHTGQVLIAAGVAKEYGFTDVDGKSPRP